MSFRSQRFRARGSVPPPASVPVNTVAPSFPSSPQVGAASVANVGTWTNSPTSYTYQHQQSDNGSTGWTDIGGATGQSYTPAAGLEGKYIRPGVQGVNGAGSGTIAYGAAVGPVGAASAMLAPTAQWTGALDSGFGTANPAKPSAASRTNARPSLRPLFLDHHFITGASDGSQVLVYAADAIEPDDLALDIDHVRVWLEGNYVDVSARTMTTYTDLRGVTRYLIGFAVEIDYAAAQAIAANGKARICAEAFCTDGTWVKQVAPEQIVHFRPGAALTAGARYDVVRTVGPSGADHTTLAAAMGYAVSNPNQYVGIKIMASGNYRPQAGTDKLTATQATEVFANAGVTANIGVPGTTAGSGNTAINLEAMRFRGQGITLDASFSANFSWVISVPNGSGLLVQFDGADIFSGNGGGTAGYSGSGSALLFNGDGPSQFWIGNYSSAVIEFKDCAFHDLAGYGVVGATSVINCDFTDVSGSAVENLKGVLHGGTMTRIGGVPSGLVTHVDALTITYSGGGTASVSRTSTSNGSSGALNGHDGFLNLYVGGVFQTSFNTASYVSEAALAAAITAYGNGFAATAGAGSRMAPKYLSRAGQVPTYVLYPAVNFSAGSITLTEIMDIHANAIVHHTLSQDNFNIGYVNIVDLIGSAPISQDRSATLQDGTYRNINVVDTSSANGATAQRGYISAASTNVNFKRISIQGSGSGVFFAAPGAGFDADCGLVDSYINYTFWSGTADSDFAWRGLVIQNGSLPSGASAGNDSKSLSGASESGFINATTGVPTLDGSLKLATGRYAGAKQPAAGDFNYWNV